MVPVKSFVPIFNALISLNSPSSVGIGPVNMLFSVLFISSIKHIMTDATTTITITRTMRDALIATIQILFTNVILPRLKYCSEERLPNSVGIVPVRFKLSVVSIINTK